jgi:hypothetical protein
VLTVNTGSHAVSEQRHEHAQQQHTSTYNCMNGQTQGPRQRTSVPAFTVTGTTFVCTFTNAHQHRHVEVVTSGPTDDRVGSTCSSTDGQGRRPRTRHDGAGSQHGYACRSGAVRSERSPG